MSNPLVCVWQMAIPFGTFLSVFHQFNILYLQHWQIRAYPEDTGGEALDICVEEQEIMPLSLKFLNHDKEAVFETKRRGSRTQRMCSTVDRIVMVYFT